MGISELERRVVELGALVKCQLRLIKNLEKRSKDLTSAKVVLYSLRVRFFLAAQEWHRVRCYGDLVENQLSLSTWKSKTGIYIVPRSSLISDLAKWTGLDISMVQVLKIPSPDVDENASGVREAGIAGMNQDDTSWQFRPLTEEEKKEFESSLDSEGKRMLEELSGKRKSI
jgi:hypothetical protein